MRKVVLVACLVSAILVGDVGFLEGSAPDGKIGSVKKMTNAAGSPIRTKLSINRISSWYDSDGTEEINTSTGNSGLVYPRGTAGVIFTAGLMWSGKFQDGRSPALRTNGHSYNTGLQRGALLGIRTGQREDPAAADVRIWRIRRDYASADLRIDAAEINSIPVGSVSDAQTDAVRAQYETDWLEWPAQKGAPFYDADGDGLYNPEIVNGSPVLFPDADEPGVGDAHQVIWYVANDVGVQQPWTNVETGIEMQMTIWGYDRADALGNVLFKKYRIIYKGIAATSASATIDSMYLAQWSDPDLGIFGDDYAGCDTVLSLGFVYQSASTDGQFTPFNLAPPAGGYDFLQGPLVPGVAGEDRNKNGVDDAVDTGIFDLKPTAPGFINLPMTAFIYFAANGTYSDPPFDANGGIQWNQMLRGLPPRPVGPPDPTPPIDPWTGQPAGPFWLYAGSDGLNSPDPNNPDGWVDGRIDGPGDRRIILASGPFTLALGDTQELVSAFVGGTSGPVGQGNNLKSVQAMKFNDGFVQTAYDSLFRLPGPPARPSVTTIPLSNKVLLDWESDSAAVAKTEDLVVIGNYVFEGYKVYQYPDASFDQTNAVLLAQFDLSNGKTILYNQVTDPNTGEPFKDPNTGEPLRLPVQYGSDNGIQRTFTVSLDNFRGGNLVNGQLYYFGVSAYNRTLDSATAQSVESYESPTSVVSVQPESPSPGTRYAYDIDDTVSGVTQEVPAGTGINDMGITAIIYNPTVQTGQTYFLTIDTTADAQTLGWTLTNSTTGDTLFGMVEDFADTTVFRVQEAGFDLRVAAPLAGVVSAVDANGEDAFGTIISSREGSLEGLSGVSNLTGQDYEIRFGEESFATRRQDLTFSQGAMRIPFSVYDVGRGPDDPSDRKVAVVVRDTFSTGIFDVVPGTGFYKTFSVSSLDYPEDDPNTTVREDSAALASGTLRTAMIAVWNSADADNTALSFVRIFEGVDLNSTSSNVRINKFHEMRAGDQFKVMLDANTTGNVSLARDDVTLINVFPNPYYGVNRAETTTNNKFVTFNHLPRQATIRIFNLAGVLVRTINKDSDTQFLNWDLQNDNGLPVASGIYIAYMELRDASGTDLGVKTLKMAIIQEQQFLRNY